jgi:hypothetical protein
METAYRLTLALRRRGVSFVLTADGRLLASPPRLLREVDRRWLATHRADLIELMTTLGWSWLAPVPPALRVDSPLGPPDAVSPALAWTVDDDDAGRNGAWRP